MVSPPYPPGYITILKKMAGRSWKKKSKRKSKMWSRGYICSCGATWVSGNIQRRTGEKVLAAHTTTNLSLADKAELKEHTDICSSCNLVIVEFIRWVLPVLTFLE